MRLLPVLVLGYSGFSPGCSRAGQRLSIGDSTSTRAALARAAQENPHDVSALTGYAEFLERYSDPACRDAYARLLEVLRGAGDTARAGVIARRLAVIDLSGRQRLHGGPGGRGELAHGPDSRAVAAVRPHGGHLAGRGRE